MNGSSSSAVAVARQPEQSASGLVQIGPAPVPTGPVDAGIAARLRIFSMLAGGFAAAVGGAGLLGWVLGNETLKSILPGHTGMKANTAVCLILSGAALVLMREPPVRWRCVVGRACAAITLAAAVLTLLEYVFVFGPGIDQLLFREPAGAFGTTVPGRMAPNTIVCFLLINACLLLLDAAAARRRRATDWLALLAVAISLVALIGYSYGVTALYGISHYTQMAFPTALALAVLAAGLLCARRDGAFFRTFSAAGVGGLTLRRMLPLVIFVPWLFGFLVTTGVRLGLYADNVDNVLIAIGLMAVLAAVIYWNAHSLNRLDVRRSEAEAVLRRSRDQWELTFNCMSEGLSYHDLHYNIVGANEAFYRLLGREQLAGMKCHDVVHGMICPPSCCPMRKTLESGQTESSEFFEPRLGRFLSIRTDPVRDATGQIVRVIHVVQDITIRKQAEEATRRLASIVEWSHDAIVGADLDGRIMSWNRGAEQIYGYPAAEALGQPLSMLYAPGTENNLGLTLAQIKRGERVQSHDSQRVRKDGVHIAVSLTVSPIHDASGAIIGASSIARDITEKKRADQAIARLNAELEDRVRQRTAELEVSNRELEAFSYSVSHDLRAPLRSIDGFSQILLEESLQQLDPEGQDFLRRIRAASQTMGQLIDALLQLSRVSRSEMRRETVDLSTLAREIAGELRQARPDRELKVEIAGGLVVEGDPRLLQVALQNLLGNAVKFTARCPDAQIEFGMREQDGERVYFVHDNGAGFEMAYAHKLFGAFQRLHPVTEFEGSGIGLATVQRIVRRHGGRVWAEGEPGQGATFYFTLP